MSGFISRAACRGRRPSQFAAFDGRQRPALSGRLLQNREVARFIVAPDGYGKTWLAIEYAETMFSWGHTLWVNATSPCFLRDLDDKTIVPMCFKVDPEVSLAIFDDVPALEPSRAQAFSEVIDALLARKCEVLVTCTPLNDSLASLQQDRVLVRSYDLLLDDDELDAVRSPDERMSKPAATMPAACRIPALAWRPEGSSDAHFAKAVLHEEMPADMLLAVGSALVLRQGSRADIESLSGIDGDDLADLAKDYPHMGFDEGIEQFEAPLVEMGNLAVALKRRMQAMVQHSTYSAPDHLVRTWADMLMERGQSTRACELIEGAYPRMKTDAWLLDNAYELTRQACFLPMLHLIKSRAYAKGDDRLKICALEALCQRIIGDAEIAIDCARRCAFDASATDDVHACGLLVLSHLAGSDLLQQVNDCLADSCLLRDNKAPRSFWDLLIEARYAGVRGPQQLIETWIRLRDQGANDDVLAIVASWFFNQLASGAVDDLGDMISSATQCEEYVRSRMSGADSRPSDYFAASAGLALEEARNHGMRCMSAPLSSAMLFGLNRVEILLMAQRGQFNDENRRELRRRNDWADEHPGMLMNQANLNRNYRRKNSIPILELQLFGCFDAMIGGEPIDKGKFKRKNTRLLLILLAAHLGREVSRDAIFKTLWPDSPLESAQKNFYTVWSNLRTALSLPDGSCPYLMRHQYGCSLEPRYVHSDVERLEEICRELLFGEPNEEQWSSLFLEIDKDYSSEFMPAENTSQTVMQVRSEYRDRLVDALVAATSRIAKTENPQWGVWFARTALKHDDTREDAYLALMRAQVASDQRTAAMNTYLKCRKMLVDRLGIDPSPEARSLYESLLDPDQPPEGD